MSIEPTVDYTAEEWFTLDDIVPSENDETLYCISVDSPDRQFLVGETLAVPTHNTEEGKAQDQLKGEASMIIGSVARLGRAAGVHLVIATQRPDASLINGETKSNLGVRVNCGRTNSTASSMILESGEGTRVKANPRGRLYLQIYGRGDHGQGLFADPKWIDEYLESKGLNPDGSPISQKKSALANLTDFSALEGDLDSREGIDNSAVIEQIRQEEAHGGSDTDDELDWDFEDDEFEVQFEDEPSDENSGSGNDNEWTPPPADPNDKMGRPELNAKKGGADQFRRPEDDWDSELNDLISEQWDE